MKFRAISIMVFLSGFVLLTSSLLGASHQKQPNYMEQRAFVAHYLVSRSLDGGALKPYEYRVKYVRSSGLWKETRYSFDGQIVTWAGTVDGLYLTGKDSLQYYGEYNPDLVRRPRASREAFEASPQFSRTEIVAGLEAYVLKETGSEAETEVAVSVETGRIPLKIVSTLKRADGQFIQVIEAIKVEFREVSENEIQLPNLPIRFDVAEQKAQSLRQAGQNDLAVLLEQAIARLKANIR